MPLCARSHQLNWWLTAKSLMARPALTLSTIAARNPAGAVQPTCKHSSSGKSDASKATNGLSTTFTCKQRLVEEYSVSFWEKVTSLSIKYRHKELFIWKKLHNGVTYSKRRGLNIQNAVMHNLSVKAKDVSVKAKDVGDAGHLETLRTKLLPEEYKELIENMTDAERTCLLQQLAEHRGFKHQGVQATNKAVAMDAMQTALVKFGEITLPKKDSSLFQSNYRAVFEQRQNKYHIANYLKTGPPHTREKVKVHIKLANEGWIKYNGSVSVDAVDCRRSSQAMGLQKVGALKFDGRKMMSSKEQVEVLSCVATAATKRVREVLGEEPEQRDMNIGRVDGWLPDKWAQETREVDVTAVENRDEVSSVDLDVTRWMAAGCKNSKSRWWEMVGERKEGTLSCNLEDLVERTSVCTFAFFTCGDPDDPAVPHIVDSNNARAYFQRVFEKSFIDSCGGLSSGPIVSGANALLGKIKNKKNIGMDYVNYKLDIQHKLGAACKASARDLRWAQEQVNPLGGALQDAAEELAELAGNRPQRKEHSDKGKKRTQREARNDSKEEDDSDSDSEEDNDDGSEEEDKKEEAPATRTKAPAAVIRAPTACATPSAAPHVTSRAPANANAAHTSNPTVPSVSNVHANTATHTAMPIVITTPTSALANFTSPTNAHNYATSSHATPLSMGPFNTQTSALVPEVHVPNIGAAPQVFTVANNIGVGFDSSRGSYGIQGGDMYGMEGGDSYGMPPLPSSYQGGGSYFTIPAYIREQSGKSPGKGQKTVVVLKEHKDEVPKKEIHRQGQASRIAGADQNTRHSLNSYPHPHLTLYLLSILVFAIGFDVHTGK
ncbi:hypothetical protein B0H19DRAFT_1328714 [Mycena capillaripes]|nr:hypothetical protein B0H19DRAFT_1328714 [Mycena capillaripes]